MSLLEFPSNKSYLLLFLKLFFANLFKRFCFSLHITNVFINNVVENFEERFYLRSYQRRDAIQKYAIGATYERRRRVS